MSQLSRIQIEGCQFFMLLLIAVAENPQYDLFNVTVEGKRLPIEISRPTLNSAGLGSVDNPF